MSVPCPHCHSTATVPLPNMGDKLGTVFSLAFRKPGKDLTFNNPELVRQFNAGQITAVCTACRKNFRRKPESGEVNAAPPRSATERLKELEQLRAEGLITSEEYQAKRSDILKDL